MKYLSNIFISMLCCVVGFIFHAYQKEWILIQFPSQTAVYKIEDERHEVTFIQKKITIFFYKHEQWHTEHNSVIWSSHNLDNVKTVTNCWLTLLEDEKIIDTDLQLLSAIMTPNKELFLSFNKDICNNQDSTYAKLMIIQGLLKTLSHHNLSIQSVRFLVHHQTLVDDHLNFSIPWPIQGYIQIV